MEENNTSNEPKIKSLNDLNILSNNIEPQNTTTNETVNQVNTQETENIPTQNIEIANNIEVKNVVTPMPEIVNPVNIPVEENVTHESIEVANIEPQNTNPPVMENTNTEPNITITDSVTATNVAVENTINNNQPVIDNTQVPVQNKTAPQVQYAEVVPQQKQPQYAEVPVQNKPTENRTDSYYDGKVFELFGLNLLNILLTAVTAGIASPWTTCMLLKYNYEHTAINGKRLKFEGNGVSLFIERLKWFLLTIVTLGIYGLWIPLKSYKWEISNVHFADEEFVKGESYFDGKFLGCFGINLVTSILNTISCGLLFTFTVSLKLKWLAKHTIINRKRIIFEGNGLKLLFKYILWLFLTIITFGIFGLWLTLKVKKWEVKNTRLRLTDDVDKKDYLTAGILVGGLIFFVPFIIILTKIIMPSVKDMNILNKLGKAKVEENNQINYEPEYNYENTENNDIEENPLEENNGEENITEEPITEEIPEENNIEENDE